MTISVWTPASTPPEDEEMKLVTCVTQKGVKNVNRAYYSNGSWHGSGSMSGVTGWADLPEPYDNDEEKEQEKARMIEALSAQQHNHFKGGESR